MAEGQPRVERSDDGHPVWIHPCTADFGEIPVDLPLGETGWEWTADGGLTPSILCHSCGIHGFWVGGEHPHFRLC